MSLQSFSTRLDSQPISSYSTTISKKCRHLPVVLDTFCRDNRRTAAPSLHASVSEQQTSSDTNSADAEDSSASSPVLFSSTSSSNKLSRSYVTLLAAAAAAEESRGISPALRDLGGYLDHSRRWGSGRMASSSTIVDGQVGAKK